MPVPLLLKAIALWAWNNKKLLAAALLAASLVLWGYRWGAGDVQADWDESSSLQRDLRQAAIDHAIDNGRRHSAQYQAEIARQRQTIILMERTLRYEIDRSYRGCIATAELVRVWRESFPAAVRSASQP